MPLSGRRWISGSLNAIRNWNKEASGSIRSNRSVGESGYINDQLLFNPSGFIIERFLYNQLYSRWEWVRLYRFVYRKALLTLLQSNLRVASLGHITHHSGSQLQAFIAGRNTRLGIIGDAFVRIYHVTQPREDNIIHKSTYHFILKTHIIIGNRRLWMPRQRPLVQLLLGAKWSKIINVRQLFLIFN